MLCSYAGLRGAVGLSLALIVANDEKLPKYARDVILLHVAGVALLTLMINATTTGWVVKKLGLNRQSDIKKNILNSISYQLEENAEDHMAVLKDKRHFNHVDWKAVAKDIEMTELRNKLKKYKDLHLEQNEVERVGDSHVDNLNNIKQKIIMRNSVSGCGGGLDNRFGTDDEILNNSNTGSELSSDADNHMRTSQLKKGKVTETELLTELRHKYLTILKSMYWEFFEEGQCGPEAVVVLMESADRALDHEDVDMKDWDFI